MAGAPGRGRRALTVERGKVAAIRARCIREQLYERSPSATPRRRRVVDRGDLARPAPARSSARARPRGAALAAAAALVGPVDGVDQRGGQRGAVVGLDQPAGLAVARRSRPGPWASTAIAGSPHAIPSTSTWPNCSRTDGQHDDVGGVEEVGQLVVAVPAGEEDVLGARCARSSRSGCSPSHSPGKPPTSTSGARRAKPRAGARVGLDQQRRRA